MKNIEISDEVYQKLITLATEMSTQDNRSTARPHIFQIRSKKKVYDWTCNGDHKVWIDQGRGIEIESVEELIDYIDPDEPGLLPSKEDLERCWDSWLETVDWKDESLDIDAFIEMTCSDLEKCTYSWEDEYHGAFFTAKACQEHIDQNRHHYIDPDTYLTHAWRNPEMELVTQFLYSLVENSQEKQ